MAIVTTPQIISLFSSPERSTELTVAFSENAKGWTSFKSFIPDGGLSLNNDYYTLKNGELLRHHTEFEIDGITPINRNNFYNTQHNSHVDVLFNEESATVKSFGSMKYEGSQAKITQNLTDNEYYNNIGKPGWYVEYGETDLQKAGEMEFKDKEGKWFSYMKGSEVNSVGDLNSEEFSFQGIALLDSISSNGKGNGGENGGGEVFGCTDRTATNYNPLATIDDGSCTYPIYGCTDPLALNYNSAATIDDESCFYDANPATCEVLTQVFEGCDDWWNYNNDPNNYPLTLPELIQHWYDILTQAGYNQNLDGTPLTLPGITNLFTNCCGPTPPNTII